jgi:twitching motility two-component system response regulator PilH
MHPSTVLFVQQEPATVARLRERLEAGGHRVLHASDAISAMAMLSGAEVRLVVTEMYLPFGRSRCLIRAIRRRGWLRRTRILAHTEHGRSADRAWARRGGAQGYVITRSGEDRLMAVMERLMTIPTPAAPGAIHLSAPTG